jgi:hypothetical protein
VEKAMTCRTWTPSIVVSILLIGVGLLFLLDNIHVIHIGSVWRFWPAILIVSGVSKLAERRGPSGWVWGSFLILCGALWLANNLHWLHVNAGTVWPLTVITLGVMMLVKALESPRPGGTWSGASSSAVREFVVFSGSKKKLDTPAFEGGEIVCVFGGVDVNLRKCGIAGAGNQAVIDVSVTFGGVEIKIPEGWRVMNRCVAVFGACEDKTLAPRPESGVASPVLVITGHALFGAVNIEN